MPSVHKIYLQAKTLKYKKLLTSLGTLSWTVWHFCLGTGTHTSSSRSKHFCSGTCVVKGFSTVLHCCRLIVLHCWWDTVTHSCLNKNKVTVKISTYKLFNR